MKTYNELETEFKRKVAWLQKRCLHQHISILPYMWAPGRFSEEVEICLDCNKVLKTRTTIKEGNCAVPPTLSLS